MPLEGPIAVETGQQSDVGAYLRSIEGRPLLTEAEEIELGHRVRAGDAEARAKFIESNLLLVVTISKHFAGKGIPLMELVEEGNLGLIKAVERFDPNHGTRFSIYAAWWIKQAIRRAIPDIHRTVRLPSHMQRMIVLYRRMAERIRVEGSGIAPHFDEVVERMNLSPVQVGMLRNAMRSTLSVDEQIQEGGGTVTRGAMLEDQSVEDPRAGAERGNLLAHVIQLIAQSPLKERDKEILKMRYGVGYERPMQIKEVAAHYKMTRERIRQIENEALRQLHDFAHSAKEKAG